MNILHISYKDTGGAGGAAVRIHESISFHGVDLQSKMLVVWKNKTETTDIYSYRDELRGISRYAMRIKEYYRFYKRKLFGDKLDNTKAIKENYYNSIYYLEEHSLVKWADIVILHWINGAINFKSFFPKVNKPIAWVFHDMTPFTGGNPYEKGRIKSLIPYFNHFLQYKKEVVERGNIIGIATNQEFIEKAAREYKTFPMQNLYKIAYPVDTSLYRYMNQGSARDLLKLHNDNKYLLFVAEDINNERKGFGMLTDIMYQLFEEEWHILCVGRGGGNLPNDSRVIDLGYISDSKKMREIYASADIFVTPSLEESYGQTTTEALLCGAPVVSYATAGAKEQIVDEVNGIIAKEFTSDSLWEAIVRAKSCNFNRERFSGRVSETFNYEVQSKIYVNLLKQIITNQ